MHYEGCCRCKSILRGTEKGFFCVEKIHNSCAGRGICPLHRRTLHPHSDRHGHLAYCEFPASGDAFAFVFSRTEAVERVSRCFNGDVSLTLTEQRNSERIFYVVTLSCGNRSAEFDVYPAEDYPNVPEIGGNTAFSVNAASLLERVNRISYAVRKSDQESRDRTSCVHFFGRQIAALDGCRAAWDVNETPFSPEPFLVFAEPLLYLKIFGSSQVDFRFSKHQVFVTDGSTTIICREAAGEPYNLERAIPHTYAEEFSVPPKAILAELKYLKDVTPKTRTPYVYLRGNELFMAINGRRFSTVIDIARQNTQTIGFDLRYVMDALRQFEKEPLVTVKISSPCNPVVIEAEGRTDCAMILPVRVKENAAA